MNQLQHIQLHNFDKQLLSHSKKYKNKKVVLYGAGTFFNIIKKNYDLSLLNIIAVADLNFSGLDLDSEKTYMGYKCVAPECIHILNPDIVLISVENTFLIERYFHIKLFKQTDKTFRYRPIYEPPLSQKFEEEFAYW